MWEKVNELVQIPQTLIRRNINLDIKQTVRGCWEIRSLGAMRAS